MAWSEPHHQFHDKLRAALPVCPHFGPIFPACLVDNPPNTNYTIREQLLYWKDKLAIPPNSDRIQQILQEFHSSTVGDHADITRTLARISSQFYWPLMKSDIITFNKNCSILRQAKHTSYYAALWFVESITYSFSCLGGYCHGFCNRST
jgi:hypothetical protein